MSPIVLLVGGMTCRGCVAAVTKAIQRVDATAGVQADLASGKVTVLSAGDPTALAAAVAKAGFSAELG